MDLKEPTLYHKEVIFYQLDRIFDDKKHQKDKNNPNRVNNN